MGAGMGSGISNATNTTDFFPVPLILVAVTLRSQRFQSSPGMIRCMNSSNNGTVNAVSPWLGLQIMPFPINRLRVGPSEVTCLPS